jgi:hypothetical protein
MKSIARIFLTATSLFLLPLIFTGCQTSSAQKSGGVELFNGQDFSGWTFCMKTNADPMKTWSVTNGVIHCTGKPLGYVRTKKTFHDYKLTVEWRFVKIAPHADNSGIFVHIQPPDKVFPQCIECQGQFQHQGDILLEGGTSADAHSANGKKTTFLPQNGPPNENPAGEWNTNCVVCDGNAIELIVNGKTMNKITGCSLSSGFIGIQSEGGEIEIRKIYLEPLK